MAADLARTRLTAAAAVMVILLTGFGFYGTQRYLVAAGRREYAILASVGAGPRALFKTVLIRDRKSTRLNSSHVAIWYAVFCLRKQAPLSLSTMLFTKYNAALISHAFISVDELLTEAVDA